MMFPTKVTCLVLLAISSSVAGESFVLTGDSTVTDGAGWGGAFCSQTLVSGVACTNFAVSGSTTASFRSNGYWAKALAKAKAESKPCYVTIQFGHNDQKIANFNATYKANLIQMAKDVTAVGAVPIFVTPLSRRNYVNGVISDILEPWAKLMRAAAASTSSSYVELLQTSITYLNKIGKTAAMKMNLSSSDHTHLDTCGQKVFGRMVADLIKAKGICSPNPFNTDATLSAELTAGTAVC